MSYQVVITFISVLFIYFGYVNSAGISRKTVSTLKDKHLVTAVAQVNITKSVYSYLNLEDFFISRFQYQPS